MEEYVESEESEELQVPVIHLDIVLEDDEFFVVDWLIHQHLFLLVQWCEKLLVHLPAVVDHVHKTQRKLVQGPRTTIYQ